MVQRMSISMPDELFEKLQNYKNSINVSKICQAAISEAIQRKKDFHNRMNETPKMDEVIERLRAQKRKSENIVFERAIMDGYEWAEIADYDELIEAVEKSEDDLEMADPNIEESIPKYLYEKHDIEFNDSVAIWDYFRAVFPEVKLIPDNMAIIRHEYKRGWYKGIQEFWQKVKGTI